MRPFLLFALAVAMGGCSAKMTPMLMPEGQESSWCYELQRGVPCIDGLMDTSGWPDEAIVCVDYVYDCAYLRDIRDWLERYAARLVVELR